MHVYCLARGAVACMGVFFAQLVEFLTFNSVHSLSLLRLTAFVNKVFCQATQYIKDDIENAVICDSLEFLQSIQQADGSFKEAYAVRHREMIVCLCCIYLLNKNCVKPFETAGYG